MPTQRITSLEEETSLYLYVTPPQLPRIDLTWVRRHRNGSPLSPNQTGLTRQARLAYKVGPLGLRGGYSDIIRDPDEADPITQQRSYDGGADLQLQPSRTSSVKLQYSVSDVRRGAAAAAAGSRSQSATLRGHLLQAKTLKWNLYYAFRQSNVMSLVDTTLNDHNGSLSLDYTPSAAVRLIGTTGVRTDRSASRMTVLRYASAVGEVRGPVRKGWDAAASASHTSNWNGMFQPYSIQTLRGSSTLSLRKGLRADVQVQISSNSDTLARLQRSITESSAGLVATPLRSIQFGLRLQAYRSGPDLWTNFTRSTSSGLDLRWKPIQSLQITGALSSSGTLPDNDPKVTTRQVSVQWDPSQRLQFTGSYTGSDQEQRQGSAEYLVGRDIVTLRMRAALSPTMTLTAGMSTADPEGGMGSRQYDASITKGFGR